MLLSNSLTPAPLSVHHSPPMTDAAVPFVPGASRVLFAVRVALRTVSAVLHRARGAADILKERFAGFKMLGIDAAPVATGSPRTRQVHVVTSVVKVPARRYGSLPVFISPAVSENHILVMPPASRKLSVPVGINVGKPFPAAVREFADLGEKSSFAVSLNLFDEKRVSVSLPTDIMFTAPSATGVRLATPFNTARFHGTSLEQLPEVDNA